MVTVGVVCGRVHHLHVVGLLLSLFGQRHLGDDAEQKGGDTVVGGVGEGYGCREEGES